MVASVPDLSGSEEGSGGYWDSERFEPPFYGTGDMLLWDRQTLGAAIRDELGESADRGAVNELVGSAEFDPRGTYAFFPVITDKDRVILLDPGDYCTEIATLSFKGCKSANGKTLDSLFRPEGDIVAFAAASAGFALAGDSRIIRLASAVLGGRVVREIRRALYLDDTIGHDFAFGHPAMAEREILPQLVEMLALEERLGFAVDRSSGMFADNSYFSLFVQYPGAAAFV